MMQDNFSLSVIIPNYNKAQFLPKCLESIVEQTLIPDEIIIVDDCSTDDSVEIVEDFVKRYEMIKLIVLEKNGGVSNARNVGARNSKSNYITFIDSDDYYYNPNKLFNEMNLVRNKTLDGCETVIAYSALVRADVNNHVYEKSLLSREWYVNGNIYYALISRSKVQSIPRDYCLRKVDFFNVGGYSYPNNFYEDLDLLIRLSRVCSFFFTGEYGTAYRMTPGGLSRRPKQQHDNEIKSIIHNYTYKEPIYIKATLKFSEYKWKLFSKVLLMIERKKSFFIKADG